MRQAWATAEGILSPARRATKGWCTGRDGCPWEITRPNLLLLRQLLSYITKDKQTESLVEKLCQRFRTAR